MSTHIYFEEAEALGVSLDESSRAAIYQLVVDVVGKHRPEIHYAILQVSSGTAIYSLPTQDVNGNSLAEAQLLNIYWLPYGVLVGSDYQSDIDDDSSTTGLADSVYDDVSNIISDMVEDQTLELKAKRYDWQRIDESQIMLIPVPSFSGYVVLEFAMQRSPRSFTSDDWEIVRLGCTAYALMKKKTEMASESSWTAGTLSLRYNSAQMASLDNLAGEYMERFRKALEAPALLP